MFDFVRKHTRALQFILVLLILPSFVAFGIQGYTKFGDDGAVAKVAGQHITQAEWDNAHRSAVERFRAQQPEADVRAFDTPEAKLASLEGLIRQYVLLAAARDQSLSAPTARVVRMFATDPQFAALRNADGSLNKQALEARGMTAAQLEGILRQELTVGQVLGGVQGTGQASSLANRQAVDALFQVREVQWQAFNPKQYLAAQNPTPEQLAAFYKDSANDALLMSPEKADVQYIVLDLDTLKQRVSVSEDDLRRAYQENLARFTTPQERRASHILIKAEASAPDAQKKAARTKAEQLLAQLQKNPAQFAELAKKNSDDPGSAANGGDLDFFGRGAMVKPFDDAAFALKPGQISGVVQSDFGFHIIQLTAVRGGAAQPFEAVRAQLEDDARKQLAQRQYAEVAEKFTNAVYEQSDSLKAVADELKLPLQTMNDVLHTPGNKDQGVLSNRRVLDALFDADNRAKARNTEAIEVGPSKMVSARIVTYHPASRQSFEQAQTLLRERWVAAAAARAARTEAMQKLALWQKAPDQAQLPAPIQLSRRTAMSHPPQLLEAAMRIPDKQLPTLTLVDLGADGVAVLRVNKVLPLQISPQEIKETESQFGAYWGKAEADAYYRALKRKYKVELINEGKKTADKAADPQKSASAAS